MPLEGWSTQRAGAAADPRWGVPATAEQSRRSQSPSMEQPERPGYRRTSVFPPPAGEAMTGTRNSTREVDGKRHQKLEWPGEDLKEASRIINIPSRAPKRTPSGPAQQAAKVLENDQTETVELGNSSCNKSSWVPCPALPHHGRPESGCGCWGSGSPALTHPAALGPKQPCPHAMLALTSGAT